MTLERARAQLDSLCRTEPKVPTQLTGIQKQAAEQAEVADFWNTLRTLSTVNSQQKGE